MSHGSEKRARTAHITIRLTPEERAKVDAAAERAGLTTGSYARGVILGAPAPRQVRRPPIERKELARLLGQIGHIGSNINQIARVANEGDGIDHVDLSRELDALGPVRDAILEALGRST